MDLVESYRKAHSHTDDL